MLKKMVTSHAKPSKEAFDHIWNYGYNLRTLNVRKPIINLHFSMTERHDSWSSKNLFSVSALAVLCLGLALLKKKKEGMGKRHLGTSRLIVSGQIGKLGVRSQKRKRFSHFGYLECIEHYLGPH